MYEFTLSIIILVLLGYIFYIKIKLGFMWEAKEISRVRREWDLAHYYYESHELDFKELTKENFLENFPVLKKTFEKSDINFIKDCLKNGAGDILPFYDNVDKFIDNILYGGKPTISRRIRKAFNNTPE